MTRAHILRTFRNAGFPLGKQGKNDWRYVSSVISIRYFSTGVYLIHVEWASGLSTKYRRFESHRDALIFVRRRLSMTYVHGNDFALNTGRQGKLRLVA